MGVAGHRDDGIAQRRFGGDDGATLERLQGFTDRQEQVAPELPGRMEAREVGRGESTLGHQGGRQGIAEGQRQQRARRGHHAQRVGLRASTDVEHDIRLRRQR